MRWILADTLLCSNENRTNNYWQVFCDIWYIFKTCTSSGVCLFLCLLSANALAETDICGNTDHNSIFYLLKISFVL